MVKPGGGDGREELRVKVMFVAALYSTMTELVRHLFMLMQVTHISKANKGKSYTLKLFPSLNLLSIINRRKLLDSCSGCDSIPSSLTILVVSTRYLNVNALCLFELVMKMCPLQCVCMCEKRCAFRFCLCKKLNIVPYNSSRTG